MKIKCKVGDTKLKFSCGDLLKNLNNYEKPFETFTKLNMDFYCKVFENMPQTMVCYYKEFNKVFGKYMDVGKPGLEKMPDSPDVVPANGHDIFNYVARYGLGNFHSQIILKFDGKLDFEKLSKAVRMSVETEPVLGCRFVEADPPYWKHLEDIDTVMFCSLEEVTDNDEAVQRFMESRLDMDHDPMIKVKLIRSGEYDTLGIKFNHTCCDGAGIKDYIQLLSDLYSKTDNNDGEFFPNPGVRGRADQDILLKSLGITDSDSLLIPGSDITIPTWAFPWKQDTSSITRFVVCKLPMDQFDKMSSFAKSEHTTINDLILTAYYRAMLRLGQPVYGVAMGISVTIDLRRYLPNNKTEAIRNFSGSVHTSLSMIENETFSETLSRVKYMMNEIKKGHPGLQSALGLERIEKICFKDTLAYYHATSRIGKKNQCRAFHGDRCVPSLSNVGIISKSLIKFGDNTVNDAFIIPPVVSAPGLLLEVGTYNDIITMAVGFFENTVLREDVERLINNIKEELVEGCR